MLLLLLVLTAHGSGSSAPARSPAFLSPGALDDVWRSAVPYVLLVTLLVVLVTALTLHCLSSTEASPAALLQKYKYRHDGYLPLPSHCEIPPSASVSTFTSSSSARTLRSVRLLPVPRPGNALPSPIRPRAVLLWLPALHSNVAHSMALLQQVANVGDAVVGLDWPGVGQGKGKAAGDDCWTWESVVEEVSEWAEEVERKFPGVPTFIGGESFGATLALATALRRPRRPIAGLLLFAPAVRLTAHPLRLALTRALSLVAPGTRVSPPWALDQLSRNLHVVEHFACDPLCLRHPLLASTAASLLSLMAFVRAGLSELSVPLLVQHGLRDLVCSPHGTRVLLQGSEALTSFDKRLVVHSRSWHDLLHEAEWEKVVETSVEWLMQRTEHMQQTTTLD